MMVLMTINMIMITMGTIVVVVIIIAMVIMSIIMEATCSSKAQVIFEKFNPKHTHID